MRSGKLEGPSPCLWLALEPQSGAAMVGHRDFLRAPWVKELAFRERSVIK